MTDQNRVLSTRLSPAATLDPEWVHGAIGDCRQVTDLVGVETHVYHRGHIRVLSGGGQMEFHGLLCPHNHVSVSVNPKLGRRPTDEEMATVRHAFDMHDAEEDNHQPGQVRNLFLPLHLPRGSVGVCDCKADEEQVVEEDGFVWSKKVRP